MNLKTLAKQATKKHKIEALQFAYTWIQEGRVSFICYALSAAGDSRPCLAPAVLYLREYIDNALGDRSYLTGWQADNGFLGHDGKADRLAWITWMLEAYGAKPPAPKADNLFALAA